MLRFDNARNFNLAANRSDSSSEIPSGSMRPRIAVAGAEDPRRDWQPALTAIAR
ncbi:hypothetical protein PR003_g11529 [Phytophthora rubi]|uniref:Uncharacterized protein n=1 Tax=Phytophthora rubi TaxID=129364 RepID=A0A6A4F2T0_9STRA|nr:hypothetical protein PR003_g11529 [Phytophthora rubi]